MSDSRNNTNNTKCTQSKSGSQASPLRPNLSTQNQAGTELEKERIGKEHIEDTSTENTNIEEKSIEDKRIAEKKIAEKRPDKRPPKPNLEDGAKKKARQPSIEGKKLNRIDDKRLAIFEAQRARQKQPICAPFPIDMLRDNFVELAQFEVAKQLDKRSIGEMDELHIAFDHLYIIDDLLQDILTSMPKHNPYGWEAVSRASNHLCLPTVGAHAKPLGDCKSILCYALTHFGVASYTSDRAYFIGHVAGYLFISYFFAHLKISYGVTPMRQHAVPNYDFHTPTIADNTRLVAALSLTTKKTIYQLAIMCAKVSLYSVNKTIEKMLIAEVNDFDKNKEQDILANRLRYGG